MKMEVSFQIKEDIRKTQLELRNAIRVHQMWVARLQEDENNVTLKTKVEESEKHIMTIGQNQKRVVDRLRRELELYQQRLKSRNKQINVENDNRFVAQQLWEHQHLQRNKSKPISLLKPSILNEIHVKNENGNIKENEIIDIDVKVDEKENSNHNNVEREKSQKCVPQLSSTMHNSRNNFTNALNKVKESLIANNVHNNEWQSIHQSDSDSSPPPESNEMSPTPSPPPLPRAGELVSQEVFLRFLGLVTPQQKAALERKRSERRKRSTTSTNKNDFLYGNFDSKRKKLSQYPYLQSNHGPPQTRSAKLRKQKKSERSSREGSPSSGEAREPRDRPRHKDAERKVCHGCGRSDVPSLLVQCASCARHVHTGCGAAGACECGAPLPEPSCSAGSPPPRDADVYKDKLAERKRLQEKNIQLCLELRKLEARACSLKDNLDDHQAEKRELLAEQIKTQRNLQKLLDFINQFKETAVSLRSSSLYWKQELSNDD